ncbi:MAG: hypothetical protein NVS4B9_22660 [Ktedonobacteraceae bacterium]
MLCQEAQFVAQFGGLVHDEGAADTDQDARDPVEVLNVAAQDDPPGYLFQAGEGWWNGAPGLVRGRLQ